jgi:hypothetical protein
MPVRQGIVLLSGDGSPQYPSHHNFGDIFYWIAAREYLEFGGTVELEYHDVEMDVVYSNPTYTFLPNMDPTTPSYREGWFRQDPSEEIRYGSDTGKHDADSDERTYVDRNKAAFLRMLAAVRMYMAPKFLVMGEMRDKPLTLLSTHSTPAAFQYDWYGQRALNNDHPDTWWEHSGTFSDPLAANQRIVFNSWQDYQASGNPTQVLLAIANLYGTAQTITVRMPKIDNFSGTDYYRIMKLNPITADFSGVSQGTLFSYTPSPIYGYTDFTATSVPAGGLALILVCDSNVGQSCKFW